MCVGLTTYWCMCVFSGGDYHCEIDNMQDAISAVTRIKAYGGISVKSCMSIDLDPFL